MAGTYFLHTRKGIDAKVIGLDDVVQQTYNEGGRDLVTTFDHHGSRSIGGLAAAIGSKISACDGKVPVVTG